MGSNYELKKNMLFNTLFLTALASFSNPHCAFSTNSNGRNLAQNDPIWIVLTSFNSLKRA